MVFLVISVVVSQLICTLGVCLFARHLLNVKQAEIEQRAEAVVREWFTPPGEGQPHKAAQVLGSLGEVVGRSAAQSIMASLSADRSHVARAANSAVDEITAAQNPLMGLLSGGKRGKASAVAQLAGLLGPMLSGGNGQNTGAAVKSVRDRLQKGG